MVLWQKYLQEFSRAYVSLDALSCNLFTIVWSLLKYCFEYWHLYFQCFWSLNFCRGFIFLCKLMFSNRVLPKHKYFELHHVPKDSHVVPMSFAKYYGGKPGDNDCQSFVIFIAFYIGFVAFHMGWPLGLKL